MAGLGDVRGRVILLVQIVHPVLVGGPVVLNVPVPICTTSELYASHAATAWLKYLLLLPEKGVFLQRLDVR